MLVLSRYRDESIIIGDDVVVTVVDVRGDRVRLGIQAPPHISVHRREIYDAIAKEKESGNDAVQQSAAQNQGGSVQQGAPTNPVDPPLGFNSFGTLPR
ncbi:MAG TPA: carbon storage regulator [Planctomycetaceae bacterium]|nr:carbon storage regulator [Planctomycetaceae bacterium]